MKRHSPAAPEPGETTAAKSTINQFPMTIQAQPRILCTQALGSRVQARALKKKRTPHHNTALLGVDADSPKRIDCRAHHGIRMQRSIVDLLERVLRRGSAAKRALLILGMHRSGTSFLTGSLQQAGLELGRHSAWNPHNTRGNRENPDFVAFHEDLLAARGCTWDRPPEGRLRWSRAEQARARALVAEFGSLPSWGFKDPRTLLFIDAWQALMPGARVIGIFRHPAAVVRSLDARGGMPRDKAFGLWRHYNARLLALHRARPFPLLSFDKPEHELHSRLNSVLAALGLNELHDDRFWAAELRHHETPAETLPADCAELYRELSARAGA